VLEELDQLKQDAYFFLLFTGCRWSELEKLGKGDIDWARGALVFRQTKNKFDHTLPLTPTLLEIVKRRVAGTTGERLFPKVESRMRRYVSLPSNNVIELRA
jgi:integrase